MTSVDISEGKEAVDVSSSDGQVCLSAGGCCRETVKLSTHEARLVAQMIILEVVRIEKNTEEE